MKTESRRQWRHIVLSKNDLCAAALAIITPNVIGYMLPDKVQTTLEVLEGFSVFIDSYLASSHLRESAGGLAAQNTLRRTISYTSDSRQWLTEHH